MIPLYHDPKFTFRFADDRIFLVFTWMASRPGGGCRSSSSTR